MLLHIAVKNLGVLEDAALDPSPGLTVITGETGTGKTMLLGGLRLLLGAKSSPSSVGPFADAAQVNGLFARHDIELGASRIVPKDGRSRGFIEGSIASAAALEETFGELVDIIGQHDQVRLQRPSAMLEMIDGALETDGREAAASYHRLWKEHQSLLDERSELGGDTMSLERELDLARHQVSEIEAAGLDPDDDERLEAMARRLRNADLIKEQLAVSVESLERLADLAGEVVGSIRKVEGLDESLAAHLPTAEELAQTSTELLWSLRQISDSGLDDPAQLAEIDSRLTALGDLKRKYGKTVPEILQYGESAARSATQLAATLSRSQSIDDEVEESRRRVEKSGLVLSDHRQRRAKEIEAEARAHMADLGLASASLNIRFEAAPPSVSGANRVTLEFASDSRLEPGPVADTASGGELSRLVLALRLAARTDGSATLVFDEIDSGVGGVTALAIGKKLAALANSSQVMCVTHLPQIAAYADVHYSVEREGARAEVVKVEGPHRVKEITRMLSGLPDSERGHETASELLASVRR